jgi:DNA-binding NtrC family response regulator
MAEHQSSQNTDDSESPQLNGAPQALDRLLVIDDDISICTVIEKLGEKAGFAVTRAVSLEEATRLLRAHRFDCLTLDLSIGKNSGVELLKVLADMACTTPIIIVSGSMRSMRDFAASIGNMMHLNLQQPFPKPIDFAKLRMALVDIKEKLDTQRKGRPAA